MTDKKMLASLILEFRKQRGWSVREMTDKFNEHLPERHQLAFPTIAAWEQGRNPVSFYVMFYLSHEANGDLKAFAANMCKVMAG